MFELDVIPERSIGCDDWEFILGMHLSQAIAIIKREVNSVKSAEVLYSDTAPLQEDLIINLPQDGIQLIFDPILQRLKIIAINNMTKVKLKYSGVVFSSDEVLPNLEQIDQSFGATHPGDYDADNNIFTLSFRGLSFEFRVDPKFQNVMNCQQDMSKSTHCNMIPANKMWLYTGNCKATAKVPPLPPSCFHNNLYLDKLEVIRSRKQTSGIKIFYYVDKNGRGPDKRELIVKDLHFGDSNQDIQSALGCPSTIYFKPEDKMKIHSRKSHQVTFTKADYFLNYHTLGLDILLDAECHTVKKFILHTNFPGHYNFNMYHRCEFSIAFHVEGPNPSPQGPLPTMDISVDTYTKWDLINEALGPLGRPVIIKKGPTCCYGYQDIIFEIMGNKHIASVTLFDSLLLV